MERILVMLLVLMEQPNGIGFLIAAKSILRFGEIKDANQRKVAEYIIIGVMRLPSTKEATIELYRRSLAQRLARRFDDSWWVPQLELALLGEFLRLGWNKALVAVHGETEAIRERERAELAWWCEHARRATQWL